MTVLVAMVGIALILIVLGDAFETIILPRRVTRRISLARLFYRYTWFIWVKSIRSLFSGKRHEAYLSFYGPLSLLLLLILWATGLVIGFGLIHWASGSMINAPERTFTLSTYLYLSGTTFFTLGLGDVTPGTAFGRALIAFEAGMGFGFLALVISYLPVLNQSFSRREVNISLLDARAGSPPTAMEMLRRHSHDHGLAELRELLREWERWTADLLESHLSYPVLAYFRSQHDNQSWLAALTCVLDASAFAVAGLDGDCKRQAQLTFAIARHAIVDLAQIFRCGPERSHPDRLSKTDLERLCGILAKGGMNLGGTDRLVEGLSELRRLYEPYVYAMSRHLHFPVPPWIPASARRDDWETSTTAPGGFRIDDVSADL
jgi:hypothetical protein